MRDERFKEKAIKAKLEKEKEEEEAFSWLQDYIKNEGYSKPYGEHPKYDQSFL